MSDDTDERVIIRAEYIGPGLVRDLDRPANVFIHIGAVLPILHEGQKEQDRVVRQRLQAILPHNQRGDV